MSRFTRSSSFPRVDAGEGALLGDGFVSDAALEEWVRMGTASRTGAVLSLADGRRFVLTDALRILGRRNGDSDPYGLTGVLLTLRSLLRRGGLLSQDGVRLGPAIYDAAFGVIAEPLAAPASASSEIVNEESRTSSVPPRTVRTF